VNFVAPLWLAAAGLVGAGVLIAHLFSSTVPPQDVLPTVRFIPESTPLTVMRSRRVSDRLLLLLRLLAVALLGFALSGAHVSRRAPSGIVLIDASRAVASLPLSVDSALAISIAGSEFVVFDSTARRVTRDELRELGRASARGSLSAALVVAHRIVAGTAGGEGTQLVIVSPTVAEEMDSAVAPLIGLWQGPVRVVRVAAAAQPAQGSWDMRVSGDDPVAAALAGVPKGSGAATVRLLRTPASRADSQWTETSGGVLVVWPANSGSLVRRAVADSQGGIASSRAVVVAQFARAEQPREGRPVARWIDGEPAATERPLGRGCIREVAIPVDVAGDIALRESFRAVARSLLAPCGGTPDFTSSHVIPSRSAAAVIPSRGAARNLATAGTLPLWLATLAALALIVEQALRGRGRRAA